MRTTPAAMLLVCAAVISGCSGADTSAASSAAPLALTATDIPDSASTTSTILTGMQIGSKRDDWQIGDRVLIGIRSIKPEQTTTRYLLIELDGRLAPGKPAKFDARTGKRPYSFASDLAQTRLTVFDETGQQIESAIGRFPVNLLGFGPFDGVSHLIGHPELRDDKDLGKDLSDADFDRMMRGWLTLFAFSGSMNKRGMFNAMMKDMIARPSILAMLLNPSAEMTFGGDQWPASAADWTHGGTPLRTVTLPLQLRIAGKPALRGEMFAVEPYPPLSLCGGLVRASAVRPDDARYRLDLWLIASARGSAGRTFAPAESPK